MAEQIVEHNTITGKTIMREMNDVEHAQWQKDNNAAIVNANNLKEHATTRASALTKLAALGLTDEEITALVG
jgi:hypothetical protein